MINTSVILILLVATLGPAAIIGLVSYGAIKAIGRNPSAAPRILVVMILSFLFAEGMAIVAILITYNFFK
jgi:F-type H+-transporting ATPase subunit c